MYIGYNASSLKLRLTHSLTDLLTRVKSCDIAHLTELDPLPLCHLPAAAPRRLSHGIASGSAGCSGALPRRAVQEQPTVPLSFHSASTPVQPHVLTSHTCLEK